MSFFSRFLGKKKKELSLAIVGLDKAGKTAIVNYLLYNRFIKTKPTVGISHEYVHFPNIRLMIADLAGQEDYRELWPKMISSSEAVVFVFDKDDIDRLDLARKLLANQVLEHMTNLTPILILLHKVDLPSKLTKNRFLALLDLDQKLASYHWKCFETSAKTGENITEAFNWLIKTFDTLKKKS